MSHFCARENESGLELRGVSRFTEDLVEHFEGAFCPYDEPSDVPAGSQLEDIEIVHVDDVDTWNISERFEDLFVVMDEQRATSLDVASIAVTSLPGSKGFAVDDFLDIFVSVDGFEGG